MRGVKHSFIHKLNGLCSDYSLFPYDKIRQGALNPVLAVALHNTQWAKNTKVHFDMEIMIAHS